MSKKVKTVEKLTYNEVQGLAQSLPLMRLGKTYKDNMEFSRVNKLLLDEINVFNEKQAKIFTDNGAEEKDGSLGFSQDTPPSILVKVNKEVAELNGQASNLEKKDTEMMDIAGYEYAIDTDPQMPSINSAILAQFVVRVEEKKEG